MILVLFLNGKGAANARSKIYFFIKNIFDSNFLCQNFKPSIFLDIKFFCLGEMGGGFKGCSWHRSNRVGLQNNEFAHVLRSGLKVICWRSLTLFLSTFLGWPDLLGLLLESLEGNARVWGWPRLGEVPESWSCVGQVIIWRSGNNYHYLLNIWEWTSFIRTFIFVLKELVNIQL